MSVLLIASETQAANTDYDFWCALEPIQSLSPDKQLPSLARALEEAFDAVTNDWWQIARALSVNQTAVLAHMPSAAANVSDFGLMLAWQSLLDSWAHRSEKVAFICGDPWVFRQLAGRSGYNALSRPPFLRWARAKMWVRGYAARAKVALSVLWARLRLSGQRHSAAPNKAAILVYGHPASSAAGTDAYFGDLMSRITQVQRFLHADCSKTDALRLCGPNTFSLHAWGSVWDAIVILFCKWRLGTEAIGLNNKWLVQRAAIVEGSTGQGAIIAWQIACQSRWLKQTNPSVVAWPWENHGWERKLVSAARKHGTETVGYAHVPVFRRELNYSPRSLPDDERGLPDIVASCGPVAERTLSAYGVPKSRLFTLGTLRFSQTMKCRYEKSAEIFFALPASREISQEMVEAARVLSRSGHNVLVRTHPMSPFQFNETETMKLSEKSLNDIDHVSAVIFASTSVGLEAVIAGIPVIRFLPRTRVGQGIPAAVTVEPQALDANDLEDGLAQPLDIVPQNQWDLFARPEYKGWENIFSGRKPN
jgi:hypothetical protein